ncbi:Uu.00g066210.m01.CDS01 [Anthostomella pinea]|uniref:HECT-type E3 ubiquitin transferase n=1 Tax=Anthostomella pinea TaxID=933095 RepID=A0AAI8VTW9_9PEZI|nr:Uu.00g066210.m01.CDS01 [Anthostomella pinea]
MNSRSNWPPFGQYDLTFRDTTFPELPRRPSYNSRRPQPDSYRSLPVQVDSSSDDDDIPIQKSKRPNQHSRSMSHPFPSLFSSKKKKHPVPDNQPGNHDPTDDRGYNSKPLPNPPQTANSRRGPQTPADFATGNCMTCAGLIRWPKELQVFRCTICLTINDLKPHNHAASRATIRPGTRGNLQAQSNGSSPPTTAVQTPHSISLDHTKTLIKTCLRAALQTWISTYAEHRQTALFPGRSPSRAPEEHVAPRRSPNKPESSPSSSATPPSFVYSATFDDSADVGLEPNPLNTTAYTRSYSTSYPDARSSTFPLTSQPSGHDLSSDAQGSQVDAKRMFKKLEDYLISCFGAHSCVNNSFVPRRTSVSQKLPEAARRPIIETKREPMREPLREPKRDDATFSELDAKLLLLGDFAENGYWWTGGQEDAPFARCSSRRPDERPSIVTLKSPRIDWSQAMEWYHAVTNAAEPWLEVYDEVMCGDPTRSLSEAALQQFEKLVLEAQGHLQRALLKCTEMLLKRPGMLMIEPQDARFLLVFLGNPLLIPGHKCYMGHYQNTNKGKNVPPAADGEAKSPIGRHSGITKRIFGLLANSSEPCHHHLVNWFSRLPEHLFLQTRDLVSGFVTYRLTRQSEKKLEPKIDMTGGLVPQMPTGRVGNNTASLHAALESSKTSKKQKQPVESQRAAYTDDWQIKAGARVMGLIFAANKLTHVRRAGVHDGRTYDHLLSTSDFYNTLVDTLDFQADFELWESKRGRFTFCQYPFFLSIWAKIQILEFDAKRQMNGKAREAFFDSILTHKDYQQHLTFSIRRDCLVEDSLTKVSEVVGSGSEDIKKALRIEFAGEEGVDGGGLRKEWFLLLVREVFNPDHGLFVYDDDSQFCYFNPNTFETSDQFFLVGVVLGLAIYNSTILDVAFPPFAFRKLLASAPPPAAGAPAHARPTMNYALDDLAEFRPALARGLRQLLEYDGDVQSTFCLDFVIDVERYGSRVRVPLCPGGESKMVTNTNRKDYVDLYVRYLLDTAVTRQFEPFKRGFFTVCAGNALTLFRPEEIELLIRGSDEPLDITSLKAVAVYMNWPKQTKPEDEPTVQWFWDTFGRASPQDQRRLLSFITGSDRIPAMGAASLVIKINCLGDDEGRYPSARTCFNSLSLYRCNSRRRLEQLLWRAVNESEGFGLK